MTQFNTPAYDIERPTGQCAFTGRRLEPGEPYVAILVEIDEQTSGASGAPAASGSKAAGLGVKRLDVSMDAWEQGQRPERIFSYWRSTVPEPNQKRRLFVDDDVLMNLFRRLADDESPQRQAFRFVLALILMRKKLLRYEGSETREADGAKQDWWRMTAKGDPEPKRVLNPQLDEAQIQQVTQQLGEILEGEV